MCCTNIGLDPAGFVMTIGSSCFTNWQVQQLTAQLSMKDSCRSCKSRMRSKTLGKVREIFLNDSYQEPKDMLPKFRILTARNWRLKHEAQFGAVLNKAMLYDACNKASHV